MEEFGSWTCDLTLFGREGRGPSLHNGNPEKKVFLAHFLQIPGKILDSQGRLERKQ